jgi:hypothetical protein
MIDLRCPNCRSIDWFDDGFSIADEVLSDHVARRRVLPAMKPAPHGGWSCAPCGHELASDSQVARYLSGLALSPLPRRQQGLSALIAALFRL